MTAQGKFYKKTSEILLKLSIFEVYIVTQHTRVDLSNVKDVNTHVYMFIKPIVLPLDENFTKS